MPVETIAPSVGEIQAVSTAAGGTALTTTVSYIQFPNGTWGVSLIPRNFATAVVVQFLFNPFLFVFKGFFIAE